MSANRKKLIVAVSLIVLLCIFGCISMAQIAQKGSEGKLPIRELTITIDESRRDELFAQLREYADKHDFDFHLSFYDSDKKIFLIEMVQEDVEILADHAPNDPTMISLDFYERDPSNPTPKETVDDLFSDLKNFVGKIPNVTIIEEK